MILVVSGVSTLIHLYSVAYIDSDRGYARYFAYLNFFVFSMLLLVLAGNFVLLIVGWAFVGFASYALISFWYRRDDRDQGGHEGLRDQRDRRRRPGARGLLHLPRARHLRLPRPSSRRRRSTSAPTRACVVAICLLLLRRRVREVRAAPAPHLAPGRDGGPDPGLGADPRGDDGDRRRLPDRAHATRSSSSAPTAADISAFIGLATLLFAATVRARGHRPEADHRLLDDQPDRLHDRRASRSAPTRRGSST